MTVKPPPAVCVPPLETTVNDVAAAGLTVIGELVPVIVPVTVSAAVRVRLPAVLRV